MKFKQRSILLVIAILFCAAYKLYYNSSSHTNRSLKTNFEKAHKLEISKKIVAPEDKSKTIQIFPKSNFAIDISSELNRLHLNIQEAQINDYNKIFQIAENWINERQIYPHDHPEMALLLKIMSTASIVKADALPKGTQIKLLLILDGGQKVIFKQKRYERDHVIEGKPYDGYDRHNAEIAAFHLDRVFDFRRSPLVVGRRVNLKQEIMPVATERLLKTFREKDGNTCYFGMCLYCNEEHMACADGEIMEGSVTLWLPEKWSKFDRHRHPYQRTYRDGYTAQWEQDEEYCNNVVKKKIPYDHGPRLLDITDGTVFDYLIGNADRHHYETFKGYGREAMLIMMDNAKSFGNPKHHEPSILAPLRQCCLLRNSTWIKMQQLQKGVLTQLLEAAMENDPINPVLHVSHINALDVRLLTLIDTVLECIKKNGLKNVIVSKWNGL